MLGEIETAGLPIPRPATPTMLVEAAELPIDTYIVKVASRCNLNCRYCYVYNMGDESYRAQPYRMSPATVSALLSRVASYCLEENLQEVTFIFHGGAPLLAARGFFLPFASGATG